MFIINTFCTSLKGLSLSLRNAITDFVRPRLFPMIDDIRYDIFHPNIQQIDFVQIHDAPI